MMTFKLFFPLLGFLILAPFTPTIDLACARLFFCEGHFYDNGFFAFLYSYGEGFGFLASGVISLLFVLSLWKKKWKMLRKPLIAMLLTFVIGAGIITNSLFKEYWGRPRPKQIIEFGGTHHYRPFWNPDFHTKNCPQKSFPSGHVAMGFYFLSVCLAGKRLRSKSLFYIGCFLTCFLGGGLMVARVAQGGHFVSDVLASFVLMWIVSFLVDRALFTSGAAEKQDHGLKSPDTSEEPDGVSKA